MGEVIRFITKSEHERARLIREARAIYNSIFPSADLNIEQQDKAPLSQKSVLQMPGAETEFRHDQVSAVTTSDFSDVSLQSCLMGASQLAKWMKQHPACLNWCSKVP